MQGQGDNFQILFQKVYEYSPHRCNIECWSKFMYYLSQISIRERAGLYIISSGYFLLSIYTEG